MSDWPTTRAATVMLVLCGPSGAGKSTLISAFRERCPDFIESVSATTRAPRPGEIDGVAYHFMSRPAFEALVAEGGFLEHAVVFGQNCYGTPRAGVERAFADGASVIMDIDVQGAAQVRERMPEAITVFVVPPDRSALEARLRGRGTEDEAAVARRLDEAEAELARASEFSYLITNDDLSAAVDDLMAIVAAERLRLA